MTDFSSSNQFPSLGYISSTPGQVFEVDAFFSTEGAFNPSCIPQFTSRTLPRVFLHNEMNMRYGGQVFAETAGH